MAQGHHALRKSSTLTTSISLKSMQRQSSMVNSEDSDISEMSFKHWHKRMQAWHENQGAKGFGDWKWCNKACKPCRWFDSISYDYKICKCCMKFKTFKTAGTFVVVAAFTYLLMFAIWHDELLPGGTIFFLFLLFLGAYFLGSILMFLGLPAMVGHILTGMLCANVPYNWLPSYDPHLLERIGNTVEKLLLIIAIMRAGLLLDMSRIKGHVGFIIQLSLVPLLCEQLLLLLASHYLLSLPWDWSALQGSLLCMVSLATVTSVMEKIRKTGYGEDRHLSTVLIAAASAAIIFGIFSYLICLSFVFPRKWPYDINSSVIKMLVNVIEQVILGLLIGIFTGCILAYFPDKRNNEAATVRILVLGLSSLAIALMCSEFDRIAAGALGVITTCVVASNMWSELGWHDRNNPVQYFYTMAYYLAQPVALSLVGFSMNFRHTNATEVGLFIAVIIIGSVGKEAICYAASISNNYSTSTKERLFICIAWFSKGTFQALLAYAVEYMIEDQKSNLNETAVQDYLTNARKVKDTTVLGILLTTPLSCYALALLAPVLLKTALRSESEAGNVTSI